jgi:hypothetical protein
MARLFKIGDQENGFGKPEENHPEDEILKKPDNLIYYQCHDRYN